MQAALRPISDRQSEDRQGRQDARHHRAVLAARPRRSDYRIALLFTRSFRLTIQKEWDGIGTGWFRAGTFLGCVFRRSCTEFLVTAHSDLQFNLRIRNESGPLPLGVRT